MRHAERAYTLTVPAIAISTLLVAVAQPTYGCESHSGVNGRVTDYGCGGDGEWKPRSDPEVARRQREEAERRERALRNAEEWTRRGDKAFGNRDFHQAYEDYSDALRWTPENQKLEAKMLLASAFQGFFGPVNSLLNLKGALRLDPSLAREQWIIEKLNELERLANRAEQFQHALTEGWRAFQNKNWPAAIKYYQIALSLCGCSGDETRKLQLGLQWAIGNQRFDSGLAASKAGNWKSSADQFANAAQAYEQALRLDPRNGNLLENKGIALANSSWLNGRDIAEHRDFHTALRRLEDARRLLPNDQHLISDIEVVRHNGAVMAYNQALDAGEGRNPTAMLERLREAESFHVPELAQLISGKMKEAQYQIDRQQLASQALVAAKRDLTAAVSDPQAKPPKKALDLPLMAAVSDSEERKGVNRNDCAFERCGSPENPNLGAPNNATPVDNYSSAAQADSNSKQGGIAATAPSAEGAFDRSQAGWDKKSTILGEQLAVAPSKTGTMEHAATDEWSDFSRKVLSAINKEDARYPHLLRKITELYDASRNLDSLTKELKDKGTLDPQNDAPWRRAKNAVDTIKTDIQSTIVVLDPGGHPQALPNDTR